MDTNDFEACDEDNITDSGEINSVQAGVAYAMAKSGKKLEEILTEYSVSDEEFTKWVLDGRFSEYAASLARGFARADAPYIWASLIESAKKGNVSAIKLYFDVWTKKQPFSEDGSTVELEALREDVFGGAI